MHFFFLIILSLYGISIYHHVLAVPHFHFDDMGTIQFNAHIRDLANIPQIWQAFNTRFLPGLSFALNYQIGGLDPTGYRIFNLGLHILTAFILYHLIIMTLKTPHMRKQGMSHAPLISAFIAALLFLTHPVQTEALNLITQRYAIMATLFYTLSVYLYARARVYESRFSMLLAFVTGICAMFSKEMAATLPLTLLVYEFYFITAEKHHWRTRVVPILPFVLLPLCIVMMRLLPTDHLAPTAQIESTLTQNLDVQEKERIFVKITGMTAGIGAYLSRGQYFLTQMRILPTYFRLLIFPIHQNIDYDIKPIFSPTEPGLLLSFIFLIGIAGLILYLYTKARLASFGLLWILIGLSVESSIIPLANLIQEYRLYLPMVGYAFFVPALLYYFQIPRQRIIYLCLTMVLLLSIATIRRNLDWTDPLLLWQDAVAKSPQKSRPYINLGFAYTAHGNYDAALKNFHKGVSLDPMNYVAFTNLGTQYRRKGEMSTSSQYFQRAIDINAHYVFAYLGLAYNYGLAGDLEQQIALCQKAIAVDPYFDESYYLLGRAYAQIGDQKAAEDQVKRLQVLKSDGLANKLLKFIQAQ